MTRPHGEGKEDAREMYVYQQMTFDEIAKRLGRSDKTIRIWAEDENWKQQRNSLLKSKINIHEKLHTLVDRLTDRMISDCDGDVELSPQSLHALTNLVNAMNSSYVYADKVKKTSADDTVKSETDGLSDETLAKIEKQLSLL
jgi:predicted transcriptional regulator